MNSTATCEGTTQDAPPVTPITPVDPKKAPKSIMRLAMKMLALISLLL